MPLLNYRTTVAAEKTLGEIHRILGRKGAREILTSYDGQGNPSAVSFQIETARGRRIYRLPADPEAVLRVLTRQHQRGEVQRRFVTREQATRIAWRIVKDWIEAQVALIETEMVTLDQIMLPYQLTTGGQTVYQAVESGQLALPPASRERR